MCSKCDETDRKIQRHRRLLETAKDAAVINGIVSLIAKMEALKQDLHPDQSKSR